ncbi:hypothetical protein [Methylorubrum populi]
MSETTNIDIHEQCARVWRSLEETEKFIAEQKQGMAGDADFGRPLTHWQIGQIAAASVAATAAMIGGVAALAKLFLP